MLAGVVPGANEAVYESDLLAAMQYVVDGGLDALVIVARPPVAAAFELLTEAHRRDSAMPLVLIADDATLARVAANPHLSGVETLPIPLPTGALASTLSRLLAERRVWRRARTAPPPDRTPL